MRTPQHGQFVVNESVLRLVDQLYNVSEAVATPNGHNLVPSHENDSRIMERQQDWIRCWLMNDVPASGWVKDLIESQHASLAVAVGSSVVATEVCSQAYGKVNRMELAEVLMEEYLAEKQVWVLEPNNMIRNACAKDEDMKDVTSQLAHVTSIPEAQLVAKLADAVVRRDSYTIHQYMTCCKMRRTRSASPPPAL